SALRKTVVEIQAADLGKVYVHRALLNREVTAFEECGWSYFPSSMVVSFVEYLYQGDYTSPPVVTTNPDSSERTRAPPPVSSRKASRSSNSVTPPPVGPLSYEKAFLTHAGLFILARHGKVLPLASMCLTRLKEVMREARDTAKESMFVENMRTLIRFLYDPCCNGSDGVWEELQKAVCGFLVSQRGWLLEAPGSDLICEEEQFAKDLLAEAINLLIDTDKLRVAAENSSEAMRLATAIPGNRSGRKKKRQALIISILVKSMKSSTLIVWCFSSN
ncbi:hypothetical protein B9Z19DRAFT_1010185, partial [Tuber borchii]